MTILQHYYTSYRDEVTGNSGFQTKAMSPGITPAQDTLIQRLISYRIPSALDPRAVSTHPIALRYLALTPHEAVLLCSQSCGPDDRGRPGNFFSHALLLDPHLLCETPPALYWRSPFWCSQDSRPHPQGKSLPVLASFEAPLAQSIDVVWEFLASEERRNQLHQLLCAIIGYSQTQRRILIADVPDHIALWIAAASLFLPPAYRSLLSFATYHHDPRQSQFLLTGVAEDTLLQASDYQTYFILNLRQNKVSHVEPSTYADMVLGWARADLYKMQLQPFFANLTSAPACTPELGKQLDDLTLYIDLPTLPPHTSVQQVQRLWHLSGSVPNSRSRALCQASLTLVGDLWSEERYVEGNDLLGDIWQTTQAETRSWLASLNPESIKGPGTLSQWYRYTETCMLLSTEQQSAALLDFWFSVPSALFKQPYTLPAFFLALPSAFMAAQRQRKRPGPLHHFQALVEGKTWYPAIEPLLDGQPRSFLPTGRGLATALWKREKAPVGLDTKRLFASSTARQAHHELIREWRNTELEPFWESYWKGFVETLSASTIPLLLDIFTFWSEDGFQVFSEQSLWPASFFLRLPGVCQKAKNERAWRVGAAALIQQARQEKRLWCSLIGDLFGV